MKEKIDIFTYVNINSYMTEILKQSKKTRHTLAEGIFNPYNLKEFFFQNIQGILTVSTRTKQKIKYFKCLKDMNKHFSEE